MRILRFLPLILISLLLTACEGNTDREWIIFNHTQNILDIKFKTNFNNIITSTDAMINQDAVIYVSSDRGGSSRQQQPGEIFEFITITNNDGDTLKVDVFNPENWSVVIKEKTMIPSNYQHEYTLHVYGHDF